MAHVMIIARVPDGLILAEMQDSTSGAFDESRRKACHLLKHVSSLSPRCSVECGSGFVFHVVQSRGVCYLSMFDCSYPRNYAFALLEDIEVMFQEELKREFGSGSVDHRSHIDTIEKPHYFVRLDRHIARKQAEYRDPSSSRALSRLHAQLTQVSGIMQHNIEELLNCGENLADVSHRARQLNASSLDLSNFAKRLARHRLMKRFASLILIISTLYIVQQHATGTLLVVGVFLSVSTCLGVLGLNKGYARQKKSDLRFAEEYHIPCDSMC